MSGEFELRAVRLGCQRVAGVGFGTGSSGWKPSALGLSAPVVRCAFCCVSRLPCGLLFRSCVRSRLLRVFPWSPSLRAPHLALDLVSLARASPHAVVLSAPCGALAGFPSGVPVPGSAHRTPCASAVNRVSAGGCTNSHRRLCVPGGEPRTHTEPSRDPKSL